MSRLLVICLLLWCTAASQAAETSASALQADLNALKELQQSKWESQKELQVKDIETVRQQIASVDKRVDDQLAQLGQSVDRFGIVIGVLGVGVTVLLVFGGFLGYRNAKSEAKEAASAAAKEVAADAASASAQDWFDKQAHSLKEQIQSLELKAARLHVEMDGHAQGVQAHAADVKKAISTAQESIGKSGVQTPDALDESTRVLAQRDRELRASDEDSYSFDDWNTRAHAAYTAGALEEAAYFWLKAGRVANAGAVNVAQVFVNRGITQGKLSQHDAAMATYDEVVRRFGDAADLALREQVARALLNKGVIQGELGQHDAAMATYEEVVRRFGAAAELTLREQVARALVNKSGTEGRLNQHDACKATVDEVLRRFGEAREPALREQVARALFNKGVAQAHLSQYESAISTYDEVLRRFGDAADPALREQVAKALVNKGVTQGQLGQSEAEMATYDEVSRRFGDAADRALSEQVAKALSGAGFQRLLRAKELLKLGNPAGQELLHTALRNQDEAVKRCTQPNGIILGNRAYVHCLLGNITAAESDFAAALRAPADGGAEIYEATLKDLEIHPLEQDAQMRALVERLWALFQQAQQG